MRNVTKVLFFLILLIGMLSSSNTMATAAPLFSEQQLAAQVVAEINAYRQAKGFSALPINSLLASLAKSQSEYQASIESVTHTGPGGSRPKDRAAAAGYAGGGTFFMSEIIYGGYNATPSAAINWWKNSALHNSVLLDKRYTELGAGVAYSGDRVYFTVELAWTGSYIAYDGTGGDSAGNVDTGTSTSGSSSSSTSSDTGGTSTSSGSTSSGSVPVAKAEPGADGSIVHIVQSGQTLWTIAAVYGVDLQTLYDLNQMNSSSLIFPGDEIIIQPPDSQPAPTVDPIAETAPTETPEPTQTPTVQPTAIPEVIGEAFSYAPPPTATPEEVPVLAEDPVQNVDAPTPLKPEIDLTDWLMIAGGGIVLAALISSRILRLKDRKNSSDS